MNCWECQQEAVQTGYFEYQETQTVEEFVFLEDDGFTRLVDRTFTQRNFVFRCPACNFQFLTDWTGIGICGLPEYKLPEQLEEYGDFHRIAPEPDITDKP